MNAKNHSALLVALMLGAGLAVTGCNRPSSTDTVGQRVDRNSDKVASSTPAPGVPATGTMGSGTSTSDTTSSMSPAGQATDDTALTSKVKAAISAEPGLNATEINVDTKNAVVTLSGMVESAPLKERAKQTASSVSGVRSVVDNLSTKSG